MGCYFGTDGIRGEFGGPILNARMVRRIGRALARWASEVAGEGAPRFALGRDTRESGCLIRDWLVEGFAAEGVAAVYDLGILPTPVTAFSGDLLGVGLAISITASHNPEGDNGIKLFASGCRKLRPETELEIEAIIEELEGDLEGGTEAVISPSELGRRAYLERFKDRFKGRVPEGMKVVVDLANGAASETAGSALRGLGIEVVVIGEAGEGSLINDGVGSEHPELLARRVFGEGADCGFAFDGDGDRLVMVDGNGLVVDGDQLLGAVALRLRERGELDGDTLVTTIQSNSGLDTAMGEAGITVLRTDVGDRNVQELVLGEEYSLGGENSGHLIFRNFLATGDGLGAAGSILSLFDAGELREMNKTVGAAVTLFPQASAAVLVGDKRPLEERLRLAAARAAVEREIGGRGRVLVRYSGTEPKLRLLVEAESGEKAEACLARLVEAVD